MYRNIKASRVAHAVVTNPTTTFNTVSYSFSRRLGSPTPMPEISGFGSKSRDDWLEQLGAWQGIVL